MTAEYGKKIGSALKAVAQLHSDTSKLLVDLDGRMEQGWSSVFENYVTRDLTYSVRANHWMAEGVYRYYMHEQYFGVADGLTVPFLEKTLDQPLLIVARITYNLGEGNDLKAVCQPWDIWGMYFAQKEIGRLVTLESWDNERVSWARLFAIPLFDVNRVEDVDVLLAKVRNANLT